MDAVRAGEWEEVLRWGGVLGHHIQEPFTPGHAMDNAIFQTLFPDPDPGRHQRLHSLFDAGTDQFEPRPPRLLGVSVAEAAYQTILEIDRGMQAGAKLVTPVIRSFYDGEPRSVRETILAQQSRSATFLTASAWHTAICIGLQRFDQNEVESLRQLSLLDIVPYFVHHSQYTGVVPGGFAQITRKIPVHVWKQSEDGTPEAVAVTDSFGMTGHMGFKFFVNGDIYDRFTCQVGLAANHDEGQSKHTDVRFLVETDANENTVYSEDMEYGARRVAEMELAPGQPVVDIEADLRHARSLILTARSQPYTDPVTGRATFAIPHLAVCHPMLSRCRLPKLH